jgi:hypothetical protein
MGSNTASTVPSLCLTSINVRQSCTGSVWTKQAPLWSYLPVVVGAKLIKSVYPIRVPYSVTACSTTPLSSRTFHRHDTYIVLYRRLCDKSNSSTVHVTARTSNYITLNCTEDGILDLGEEHTHCVNMALRSGHLLLQMYAPLHTTLSFPSSLAHAPTHTHSHAFTFLHIPCDVRPAHTRMHSHALSFTNIPCDVRTSRVHWLHHPVL